MEPSIVMFIGIALLAIALIFILRQLVLWYTGINEVIKELKSSNLLNREILEELRKK